MITEKEKPKFRRDMLKNISVGEELVVHGLTWRDVENSRAKCWTFSKIIGGKIITSAKQQENGLFDFSIKRIK